MSLAEKENLKQYQVNSINIENIYSEIKQKEYCKFL